MRNVTVLLLFVVVFLIGIVWLQIFLSKKENKWYGLILPIISLINPILVVLSTATFSTFTETTITVNGQEVAKTVSSNIHPIGETIVQMLFAILYTSIPTIILLVIYFACREKYRIKKQLDKMKIGDL